MATPSPRPKCWDLVTASFAPAGSLAEARGRHTSTLLSDGRVLVVGGWGVDGFLASVEVWDPATGTFSAAGTLAGAHENHTATLLADGRVLVTGGWGGQSAFALAETWGSATPAAGE